MRRIAVAGHSLGAYATLAAAGLIVPNEPSFRDTRVIAGIPISMSEQFPRAAYRDIRIPLLHITGTHDSSIVYKTLPHDRRVPFESINGRDQYLLTIAGIDYVLSPRWRLMIGAEYGPARSTAEVTHANAPTEKVDYHQLYVSTGLSYRF